MTTLWVATDGQQFKQLVLETILKPTSFPHFVERPNELRAERAQRWRNEFKELASKQHQHVLATVCWLFHECQGAQLVTALQTVADRSIAYSDLSAFQFKVGLLETEISYRLLGSAKTNIITIRASSP